MEVEDAVFNVAVVNSEATLVGNFAAHHLDSELDAVVGAVAAVADVLQARIAAATESLPTQGACRRASRAVIA